MDQFRHAVRGLARAPMFSALTLATLAIGIGANTAIFSVISGVLLKPLPHPEPDRLVGVWQTAPGLGFKVLNASPSIYFTYREENRVFEDIALWDERSFTVTGLAEPERVDGLQMTFSLLPILRVRPAAGRLFTQPDDQPGSPETVVLSYGYWQRKFGGRLEAVGQRMMIDGKGHTVIGVLPQDFRFLDVDADLILPMRLNRAEVFVGDFSYQSVARLKPGVTLEQANADVGRMFPLTYEKFPMPPGFPRKMLVDARIGPNVRWLKEDLVGDVGKVLWVLMGTVGIVLLIACANVANLFLVRAEGRHREFAIRAALGAGWGRIAQSLLVESVTLAVAGGILGLGLAWAGVRLLVALEPAKLPRLAAIGIDAPVLLFTLGISLAAGLLCGLAPLFRFGRRNISVALKEGSRGASQGRERHRVRATLVVAQIALSLVLLVSAGLMIRTFQAMRNVNPGFVRPGEVLTLRVSIPEGLIRDPGQVVRTHEQILARIRQIPGVTSAAVTSIVPMSGQNSADPLFIEDHPLPEGQLPPIRRYKWIADGYFRTMGNPILAGRDLTWADAYTQGATPTLFSESLARLYWKSPAEALGKRVRESPTGPWREIVGVVGDERDDGVSRPVQPIVYWPVAVRKFWDEDYRAQRGLVYVIRGARTGTSGFLGEIRQAVWSVNASLPVANVRTLARIYQRSMARTSFTLVMLAIASGMALLLGVVGIYGVIAYSVAQRTREIGIRMALGARHGEVRALFVRHAMLLTAAGVAIGAAAAAALTRGMSTLLFEVSPLDPVTYAAVSLVLAAAALASSYLPARRATTVDPVQALRAE